MSTKAKAAAVVPTPAQVALVERQAKQAAEEAMGQVITLQYSVGVTRIRVAATGPIVECLPMPPRPSATGKTLRATWTVTIKDAQGKKHAAILDKLPKKAPALEAAAKSKRPDWDKVDALVRQVKSDHRRSGIAPLADPRPPQVMKEVRSKAPRPIQRKRAAVGRSSAPRKRSTVTVL